MADPKSKAASCPICERPVLETKYRPFCSRRCADVDLGRWFSESYRLPTKEPEEEEDGLPPQATNPTKPDED